MNPLAADSENFEEHYGGGEKAGDEVDQVSFMSNAMPSKRRESNVSSDIRMSRSGTVHVHMMSSISDIVANGASTDVGNICKELRSRWEKGRIYRLFILNCPL